MTGIEIERLDFAAAVLEFIIKKQPKTVNEFIIAYACDNGMTTKRCYDILARLKHLKLIHFDSEFRMYRYNSDKYFKDLSALKSFHEQIKSWNH